jgi:hypothetical protein
MDRQEILKAVEARMANGEPFTFVQLHSPFSGQEVAAFRIADRAIQKWRKKGWIAYALEGRTPVWSLTPAGRAVLSEEAR